LRAYAANDYCHAREGGKVGDVWIQWQLLAPSYPTASAGETCAAGQSGARKAAGVPGSAHGLCKDGATRLANNGATVARLEAIYGWEAGKMASL
jgi:hypothetical protein